MEEIKTSAKEPVAEETPEAVEETVVEDTTENTKAPVGETAEEVEPAVAEKTESREDFGKMLETSSAPEPGKLFKGQKVEGAVVRVTDQWAFIDLGGKSEGGIKLEELGSESDEGEVNAPEVGDMIEAFIGSMADGEIVLTRKMSLRDSSKTAVEEAFSTGIPVQGRVAKAIKSGFEVRVSGLRAFCPLSQIDMRWPRNPEIYVNEIYDFKVLEFKDRGRNIIVSRRALMEEDKVKTLASLKAKVVVGQNVTGTVRSIQKFGAFVDLGGADALIPISEMSWQKIGDPKEILSDGQEITAKVLSADWDNERISLSLKSLEEDPWVKVAEKFKVGDRIEGKVARLAQFGAFVTLDEGVDGLVHVSELGAGKRVNHPKEVVEVGQDVEVQVVGVDLASHRISLSMDLGHFDNLDQLPSKGTILTGTVENVADFGIFVKLPSGHTGMVPNAEMATPRDADHGRMFPAGSEVEVMVLSVEESGRRIRLSRKAAKRRKQAEEAKEFANYSSDNGSFGTFADLLKKS